MRVRNRIKEIVFWAEDYCFVFFENGNEQRVYHVTLDIKRYLVKRQAVLIGQTDWWTFAQSDINAKIVMQRNSSRRVQSTTLTISQCHLNVSLFSAIFITNIAHFVFSENWSGMCWVVHAKTEITHNFKECSLYNINRAESLFSNHNVTLKPSVGLMHTLCHKKSYFSWFTPCQVIARLL